MSSHLATYVFYNLGSWHLPLIYIRSAWTAYFPHKLHSTCTVHTPSLLFALQPYQMDDLHYIYLRLNTILHC